LVVRDAQSAKNVLIYVDRAEPLTAEIRVKGARRSSGASRNVAYRALSLPLPGNTSAQFTELTREVLQRLDPVGIRYAKL
jgi:hypothetical protein